MRLDQIWQDIRRGENIDLYITVLVTVLLVILNVFSIVSPEIVASLTLSVFALITITNLVNRYRLEHIEELLETQESLEIPDAFPPDFEQRIEGAKEIWLTGIHHSSLMSEHYQCFENMLKNGGALYVMVVDPDGAACAMTAMRFAGDIPADQERARTRSNITQLQRLASAAPGRVEIRTIDYLFENSVILIDPDLIDAIAYTQRYTFRTRGGARKPKLIYTPGDGEWYALVRSEVLAIWDCGVPL